MRDWIQRHILGSAATALVVIVVLIGWGITALRSMGDESAAPAAPRPSTGAPTRPAAGGRASIGAAPASRPPRPAPTCGDLDLADQVGQLVMVGTPVDDAQSLADAVARYKLGGIFL